jgi:hypothetical protein
MSSFWPGKYALDCQCGAPSYGAHVWRRVTQEKEDNGTERLILLWRRQRLSGRVQRPRERCCIALMAIWAKWSGCLPKAIER